MKKGDIILVEFPFTDLSSKKKRPALVLATENTDVTVAFITSNTANPLVHEVLLQPNTHNRLKQASLVKTRKLATLAASLISGRIGELTAAELQQVDVGLRLGLQL